MISVSVKRKIIFLFFCFVIFSNGYSQEFANESKREYNNFYFQFGGPEKVLYDLLTNEAIGTTNQEFISYYYVPVGSNKIYKASEISVRSINTNFDRFLSYKFKTSENAKKWI